VNVDRMGAPWASVAALRPTARALLAWPLNHPATVERPGHSYCVGIGQGAGAPPRCFFISVECAGAGSSLFPAVRHACRNPRVLIVHHEEHSQTSPEGKATPLKVRAEKAGPPSKNAKQGDRARRRAASLRCPLCQLHRSRSQQARDRGRLSSQRLKRAHALQQPAWRPSVIAPGFTTHQTVQYGQAPSAEPR
jgi:hypothetical protein